MMSLVDIQVVVFVFNKKIKKIREILKRNLSNPEFLELHQQYEDELFRKLGYDPVTKTFVKGGK